MIGDRSRINVRFKDAYNSLVHKTRKNVEEAIEDKIGELPPRTGLFLTEDDEKLPVFGPIGGAEKVISRKKTKGFHSGSRIVLTKDNYGARSTGVGGAGGTKCEAIDIVAGTLSAEKDIHDDRTKTRANFVTDGARIYLTERGNINHYFTTENTDPITSISDNLKSGIGIKADHTLVIGRERVRILAGLGKANGGERTVNGNEEIRAAIEIGSITEDRYEKAVRGESLVRYLYEMNSYINELAQKVNDLERLVMKYKAAMATHVHLTTAPGAPTSPAFQAVSQGLSGTRLFMHQQLDGAVEEFHKAKTDRQYLGTPDGTLKGVPDDFILSNTVYIGR